MNTLTSLKCAAVLLPALAVGMPMANADDEKRDDPQDAAKTSSEFGSDREYQHKDTTVPSREQASAKNEFFETMPDRGFASDSLVGQEVMSRKNDKSVGEINNLLIDENGQIVAVILSVGGTLGMGERDVAIAWDQIERRVDGDETTLLVNQTQQNLKDAPKYSGETKSSSQTKNSGGDKKGDKKHTDQGQKRHEYGQDSQEKNWQERRETALDRSDKNKADAYVYKTDKNKSDANKSDMKKSDMNMSDMNKSDANKSGANEIAHSQFLATIPARGYHSDNLVGQEVTNRGTNESIGEVRDLVLDENGQVMALIVSVGGVMGLGERDVAISWDQIERNVDGDEITLTTDLNKESLEEAPKYSREEKKSSQ